MSMFPVDSECQCNPSRLARIHRGLADPIRLRMLALMRAKPVNPEELSRVFALKDHVITKHLHYLCDAGVVSRRRREGQTPYYSIRKLAECPEAKLVHLTLDLLRREPVMNADSTMLKIVQEAGRPDSEDNQSCQSALNGLQNVVDDLSPKHELHQVSTAQVR